MISIVIPAYNEEKSISNTLESLVKQKTNRKFEVVVVDNNSTDKTVEMVKKFSSKLDLRIVHQKKKGRGPARAYGFRKTKGEYIFSTDADAMVPDDWIEELMKQLDTPDISADTCPSKVDDLGFIRNACFNCFQPIAMFLYKVLYGHYWLSGFGFAIKKSIYKKSGGFDEDLNTLEDIDLSFKVARCGKIKFINHPVLFSGRRFRKGIIRGMASYLPQFFYLKSDKRKVQMDDPR